MVINTPEISRVGMFRIIDEGGEVKNLGLLNVNFIGDDDVGGIVGHLENGTIEDCYTTGSITGQTVSDAGGDYIGGIAGFVGELGNIYRCYSTTVIRGRTIVGGIAGHLSGIIENSVALNPSLTPMGVTQNNFGRIAGLVDGATGDISDAYARNDMVLTISNGANGVNIDATGYSYNDRGFWENIVGFSFTDSIPAGPWRWSDTTGLPFMGITPTVLP
jgi:hypothetical protein